MMRVEALSVTLGGRRILSDITLGAVEPGELVGLIGPNASGKSTLLRALSGGVGFDGEILLAGRPIARLQAADRRSRIALMPQTPPQGSSLSPFELLISFAHALRLGLAAGELRTRIADLFCRLGLADEAHRPLAELSGGKRQLVGLCLALVKQPGVLLLDEPTSALDLRWQLAVLDLARAYVVERGAIGLVAVHDINLALRYCHRIIVLKGGRLAACGAPAEILHPSLIRDVYGVEARIEACGAGHPQLVLDHPHPQSA